MNIVRNGAVPAIFRLDPHGEHGPTVKCSCGWKRHHHRAKVLSAAADRHANKRHGGMSLWR